MKGLNVQIRNKRCQVVQARFNIFIVTQYSQKTIKADVTLYRKRIFTRPSYTSIISFLGNAPEVGKMLVIKVYYNTYDGKAMYSIILYTCIFVLSIYTILLTGCMLIRHYTNYNALVSLYAPNVIHPIRGQFSWVVSIPLCSCVL